MAAKHGYLSVCQLIIDGIEEKHPKSVGRKNPLHFAAENGHFSICQLIIDKNEFVEVIWDGTTIYSTQLDATQRHFWSSVTLYPPNIRDQRTELFNKWYIHDEKHTQEAILAFHQYGGTGDHANDFVMNRNEIVKTLSITSILKDELRYQFRHIDLENEDACFETILDQHPSVSELAE